MSRPWPARPRAVVIISLVVTVMVTAVGYGLAAADRGDVVLGPGDITVEVDIEYSRFVPDHLTVVEGTRVRFLVVNGDPIHHEFITGGPEVHLRHARGTEAEHPSIPGEVSIDPNGRAVTTFIFKHPGRFEFACHLPGHYEYGMHGEIEVVPSPTD
jgi:uncharacterized cupredoxin-like copper-binding protein